MSCKELVQVERASSVGRFKQRANIACIDFAKDYIEFFRWLFVLGVHNNPSVHAVCDVLPYTVEAVSATVIKEHTGVYSVQRPSFTFPRSYIARQCL